ncbi:uncharacterized protein PITG_16789 [Phytophthora infestans T30-4]|uniref:Uncharacterized protein n=3 Tax=Phytophthora infestans TaxID=4787 RepID=D0NUV8_PHYIT|nr:uncharacterized protein PITG_16789 [Phytophthora infestans T30-4]EEY65481.1 conserved hypothetical protein [Phytophthora infestans T30-4]KAF4148904.1 hypothetical protein GN958_ATG01918 [Phytophthora infestans]|eukprot:XP_002897110.1 conserved hypothetical protein [Phytophthora infestans T30-4]
MPPTLATPSCGSRKLDILGGKATCRPSLCIPHCQCGTKQSMPRSSEREQFIMEIIDLQAVLILEEEDDEDLGFGTLGPGLLEISEETPTEELAELLQLVVGHRLLVPRERLPLSIDFAYNVFRWLPDEDFKQQTRTTRSTFSKILAAIENNNFFLAT